MALVPKYRHSYCNRYGKPCRVDILEEGYEGPVIEVDAGPAPISIAYESTSDNKFDPIRGSSATVTLIGSEAFEMEWLWTASERKYMVESYINGSLDWRGFIIPNGFRYDFIGGKYYAQLTASDGLATLQNKPFVSDSGELYNLVDLTFNDGSKYPFILIATEILRKLGLDLNLWVCVDVFESKQPKTGGREADPLAYAYVDVRTYINDSQRDDIPYWQDIDGAWDCHRVLQNLLTIWGAKVYQEGGAWKLKRINADASDTPQKVWRKYNTAAVYIGQENVSENVAGDCNSNAIKLINASHVMAMDRVYSQVRVNYKYTFLREGDTPVNLVKNGNLNWPAFSLTPPDWVRSSPRPFHIERITGTPPCAPTGICTGIEVYGEQGANIPTVDAWLSTDEIDVSQGDNLQLSWWERAPRIGSNNAPSFGLYAILCRGNSSDPRTYYWLVNDGVAGGGVKTKWIQSESAIYFQGVSGLQLPELAAQDWWRQIKLAPPPIPISGELIIAIVGLGSNYTQYSMVGGVPSSKVRFRVYTNTPNSTETQVWAVGSAFGRLSVTGFFAGLIKNISSEEVATIHPYLYPAVPRQEYTDRPDPIEIFNGDTLDINHVSTITIPGITGKQFWDTLDNKYGYSALGLLLARSIADQYWTPNRILEGDFQGEDINFSSRITLDYLPGVRFIVQRGTWDVKGCRWIGTTLIQVSNAPLPDGGSDDGNTVDPMWEDTGVIRCVKNSFGQNNGQTEKQQEDVNPASNTFEDLRWVPAGEDLTMCPIGEASQYIWGADDAGYDPDNLNTFPFSKDGNTVQVTFTNTGGKYLFFLHRDNLGLVVSIIDGFGSETISDWQYLADAVIDGHTYKVMRMNYPTGIYSNLPMDFIFT